MTKINVFETYKEFNQSDFLRDYLRGTSKAAKAINWQERFEEQQWQEDKCLEKLLYLSNRKESPLRKNFPYEDLKEIFDKSVQVRDGKGLEMECAIELFVEKEDTKREEYFFLQYQPGDCTPLMHILPSGGYKNISTMVRSAKKFMQGMSTKHYQCRLLSEKYGVRFTPAFYTIIKEQLQEPAAKEEIQEKQQEMKDEKKHLIETDLLDELDFISKLKIKFLFWFFERASIKNMETAYITRGLNRQEREEFERLY
ncbi:MAG: hypothetical protein KKA65_03555 [Nanoarchaeota archaeon]|nr:hypothetical protein [Nanoarchaeota archaeon]MBU4352090.1 hypothetical protein [Nanoarchaeota archaeon]MBU4456554.1 hypothetical protein [Nanoarchaeota archaeon]MCG2719912.1 hypothetical protein [Nanoarchaeota archaeon]